MKPILFISLMLLVILGMNFYVFFRLWHIIPAGNIGRTILVVSAIILVSSFFVGMLGGYFLPTSIAGIFYRIGSSWFMIALYLLLIFLALDLLRIVLPMQKILFGNWLTISVLALFLTSIFTYGYIQYKNKVRVELSVPIQKKINPLKIVAISDLHLGHGIGKAEFEQWIELINRENPDIVLIAGDIIDNFTKPLQEQNMAASFGKIKSRYGTFACLGNHESIGNLSQSLDFLHAADITILQDTAILLNNEFYIIGRDDRTNAARKSIAELLQTLDTTKPLILLDHQPFHLNETADNKIDLQISGHTHRGQIFPITWITDRMYEISHGYLQKDDSHIYVSSGIGIWGGKFRIGSQSEYVVMTITK